MIIDPRIHSKYPSFPRILNLSFKNFEAITDVTETHNVRSGVFSDAGSNAHAAKIAASLIPIVINQAEHSHCFR